jgi:hypothetical protein
MSVEMMRGPISWMVGFMGENKTITIHQTTGVTVVGNTGGTSGSTTITDTTLPAFIEAIQEEDIDGTTVQATDRMVVVDTAGTSITISDNDQITVDSSKLAIKRVLPIKPGDNELVVRLVVEGV